MYPTYTRKKGKQYRYYVSKSELRYGVSAKTCERIPADAIEAAAISQIKTVLASPEAIAAVCACIQKNGLQIDEANTVIAMSQLGTIWPQLFPAEQHRLVNLMIERADLVPGGLKFKWHELGWQALIGEFSSGSIGAELAEMEGAA